MRKCPAPGCGLMWLDPKPTEEDIPLAYRDYFTHAKPAKDQDRPRRGLYRRAKSFYREARKEGYLAVRYGYRRDATPAWKKCAGMLLHVSPRRRANLDARAMHLPGDRPGRLLEVGCGSGRSLQAMRDLGWQVEGVDFDPAAVDNARTRGLDVRLGDLEAQRYPDDRFDAVAMIHLLEHVHDPGGLLRECRRILKPAGRLVAVTPNGESLGHGLFRDRWLGLDPPRHLQIFNERSLQKIAVGVGFRTVEVTTTSHGAKDLFLGSLAIRRTGRHVLNETPPRAAELRARGFQWMEWALLHFRPRFGEEIVLKAGK